MANEAQKVMAHFSCQCSAYLQFLSAQPKELAGGDFMCKSLRETNLRLFRWRHLPKPYSHYGKISGRKLPLRLLLLKLDSHSEYHAQSEMSFEVYYSINVYKIPMT